MSELKYNLEYWNGNRHIETIHYNISKPLALSIMKKLKVSTHSLGTFKLKLNK